MSSSLARMERRATRSQDEKKLGGLLHSSLTLAIVSMAKEHSAGATRKLDVTDLLSQDGFDHALIAATPCLLEIWTSSSLIGFHQLITSAAASKFDMPTFLRRLTDEAGHMEFDETMFDGTRVRIRADLFAIPVVGWMQSIANFIPAPESMQAIARSFKECGLAGKGSSVVVSPTLRDVDTAADMLPGTVRILLQLLQSPMSNPDFAVGEAMAPLLGIDALQDGFGQEDFLCNRLMTGVRIQVVKADEAFEEDVFSGRAEETHGLELWRSRMTSLLPSGIQMLQPQTFARGRSSLAVEIVTGHLTLDAHKAGLPMAPVFDEVEMKERDGYVMISAVLDGHSLGPVSVPSLAAFSDAEWFAEQMVQLSHSTVGSERKTRQKGTLQ